jgi:hypothetical protein
MTLSNRTRWNWALDATVFLAALMAAVSGIYFLYLPSGGFQGGRNPLYDLTILFARTTWSDLHLWAGILMIIVAAVHLIYHWSWVRMMARRLLAWVTGRGVGMSVGARINVAVNAAIGLGFLLSAVSGVALLFRPTGSGWLTADFGFLSGFTWDVIHTWSSVILIVAAMAHFLIHWRWIEKVTRGFFVGHKPSTSVRPVAASVVNG